MIIIEKKEFYKYKIIIWANLFLHHKPNKK